LLNSKGPCYGNGRRRDRDWERTLVPVDGLSAVRHPVRIRTEYQIQDFDVFSIGFETRCPVGAKRTALSMLLSLLRIVPSVIVPAMANNRAFGEHLPSDAMMLLFGVPVMTSRQLCSTAKPCTQASGLVGGVLDYNRDTRRWGTRF
jgi:hypothetical protein